MFHVSIFVFVTWKLEQEVALFYEHQQNDWKFFTFDSLLSMSRKHLFELLDFHGRRMMETIL